MKAFLRWFRALAAEVWREGAWVYAPPLVISASSPIWRAAPPPRIDPAAAVKAATTDPEVVAARRAGFRLILNESKA
jgi:hypothetical protein